MFLSLPSSFNLLPQANENYIVRKRAEEQMYLLAISGVTPL